jgi:hypothetical protein
MYLVSGYPPLDAVFDQVVYAADQTTGYEKSLKDLTLALSSTPNKSMMAKLPNASMDSKGQGICIPNSIHQINV